jgi:hypothetical protein
MKSAIIAALLGYAGIAHAGNGTLVVDVVKADGHAVAADCEIRTAGATPLLKKLAAGTGVAQSGLAAGGYDVKCTSRIGAMTGTLRVTVTSGKTSRFKIKLGGGGAPTLSGTVTDMTGKPMAGKVEIVLTVDLGADGRFDAGTLPAGRYTVRYAGGTASETVSVTAGRPAKVNLRVGPAVKMK